MGLRAKRIVFQVSFVVVACVIIEIVLRCIGYQPGDLRPSWLWFKPVDSLYIIHDFYTNDKGLLVAEKDYWVPYHQYINAEGFRGPELNTLDSTKKKILFIGDSFTWGLSAKPYQDSSFCDILQHETNYNIINFGIPATDPPQYCKIAETYLPQIKPDLAFVLFYMGNDLMLEDRKLEPNKPTYFWTNAGGVEINIDGHHFKTPQESYNYLANEKYFLKKPKHWYEWVIAKSALLSRLYAIKFRIKEKLTYEHARRDSGISRKYLTRIKEVARQNNIELKFVMIPDIKEAGMDEQKYRERYSSLLLNDSLKADWLLPCPVKEDYVAVPDGHLNNRGHRYYAEYLKKVLAAHFKP